MALTYIALAVGITLYLIILISAINVSKKEKGYDKKAINTLWRAHDLLLGVLIGYVSAGLTG